MKSFLNCVNITILGITYKFLISFLYSSIKIGKYEPEVITNVYSNSISFNFSIPS